MHPREDIVNDYIDGVLSEADRQQVEQHLAVCAECALLAEELRQVMGAANALVDQNPPDRVWPLLANRFVYQSHAERPEVVAFERASAPRKSAWSWRPAWPLATAALVVLAFLAGRLIEQRHQLRLPVQQAAAPVAPAPVSADAPSQLRERILLVAVSDHLERSQLVLVELANAETSGELDISTERQSADELLASNRLYRQTAMEMGQSNLADLLDDLERVLVEVARGPSQVSVQQLAEIQQRIEAQGILFKVKVIGSEVRERENSINAGRKLPVS